MVIKPLLKKKKGACGAISPANISPANSSRQPSPATTIQQAKGTGHLSLDRTGNGLMIAAISLMIVPGAGKIGPLWIFCVGN